MRVALIVRLDRYGRIKIKCHDCSKSIEATMNDEILHARASCAAGWSEAAYTMARRRDIEGWNIGQRLRQKKSKWKNARGEKGKGADSARWRDTFQGRGWSDSRVSYPRPFPLFQRIWFLPPLAPTYYYTTISATCYPSPDAPNPEHTSAGIETWSPGLRYFSTGRTKARENISVCCLSFISAFLEWHRCHWTHRRPSPLICLEFAEDNINVSSYGKKTHGDVIPFLLCR